MALVNSIASESSTPGVTSFNTTSLGSLVNGNVVTVWVTYLAPAQRTIGVTGSGAASWTRDAGASIYNGPDQWGVEVFYGVVNASSTAPVVSVSDAGTGGYIGVLTAQWDSYSSWIGAITNRQANPGTGTGAVTTSNVNLTSQPARQIGVFFNYTAASAPTAVAGFTDHGSMFGGYVRLESRTVGATGNSAATATVVSGQGGSTYYSTQMAFSEAGSPTPAVLSSATPSGTLGTQTSATLGATTDQSSGTLYGVVDTAGNISGITAAQIIAGQKNNSTSALSASNTAVSTTSPATGITGLTAATLYSYALVQNNANGDSNVLTGTFTTAAATVNPSVRNFGPQGALRTLINL